MNLYYALSKSPGIYSRLYEQQQDGKIVENTQGKAKLLESIVEEYRKSWSDKKDWYTHRFSEYQSAIISEYGEYQTLSFKMKNSSHLLVGHGGVSVLESSLSLHRMYGVPYIPGSAIKGVCANVCHTFLGKENSQYLMDGDYYIALFGTQEQAGYIEFHDAWITPESLGGAIRLDVMTPHHQKYNAGEQAAPRDDDDPVPIPFLAASGCFRFLLTCSSNVLPEEQAQQWLEIAKEIVIFALKHHGIGSKTSSGYGQMTEAGGDGLHANK
ncbi:type III-B CRISPR module RAMP protein Cmr6 [Paenibacillus azoreducens]|uniref:type III-B CRISPR module RAMP protein Cmr6 n=1 Tax=Paenibacillus azoreducens TaxID=116718 RepID=UPI0039F49959